MMQAGLVDLPRHAPVLRVTSREDWSRTDGVSTNGVAAQQ